MSADVASSALAKALSSAVRALALAHALGAPAEPVDEASLLLRKLIAGELSPAPRRKRRRKVKKKEKKPVVLPSYPLPSAWDPEPVSIEIEASQCRALLLDIIVRAMHDWVLYRHHSRMQLREVAEDAYTWLFEEKPGHPWWAIRGESGQELTAFLTICDVLDIDPSYVRRKAKKMTVQDIRKAGRPPERRKSQQQEGSSYREHPVTTDVDIETIDRPEPGRFHSQYEAHFSVGYT